MFERMIFQLTGDRFEETVINTVMRVTPRIQRAIMDNKLVEKHNVAKWIMEQADVMPRFASVQLTTWVNIVVRANRVELGGRMVSVSKWKLKASV